MFFFALFLILLIACLGLAQKHRAGILRSVLRASNKNSELVKDPYLLSLVFFICADAPQPTNLAEYQVSCTNITHTHRFFVVLVDAFTDADDDVRAVDCHVNLLNFRRQVRSLNFFFWQRGEKLLSKIHGTEWEDGEN